MKAYIATALVAVMALSLAVTFQNCSKVEFAKSASGSNTSLGGPIEGGGSGDGDQDATPIPDDLDICNGVSCDLNPITTKPAVTTILLALGDEANSQLVINGASSQFIAETVIRYSTPKANPRILLVRDRNNNNESNEDTIYVKNVLLSRYQVTFLEEPVGGLTTSDVQDYDLIWFNNPGHAMGSVQSRDVLLAFPGAVVLQGDDLTRGKGFSMTELTGLNHVDNGAQVTCGGQSYPHDNNKDYQYRVTAQGANQTTLEFRYGNDIDLSTPARSDLEILATAVGGADSCTEARPAIVRYVK